MSYMSSWKKGVCCLEAEGWGPQQAAMSHCARVQGGAEEGQGRHAWIVDGDSVPQSGVSLGANDGDEETWPILAS